MKTIGASLRLMCFVLSVPWPTKEEGFQFSLAMIRRIGLRVIASLRWRSGLEWASK